MMAVVYAGGPLSSVLVNKYGSRPVVMCGGLLCCVGMTLASYSNTVTELYLTAGATTGLGLAFNLQPALTIIGQYFYRKRPLAFGLAMTGSPVFLSTLATLSQFLNGYYGWRGSFLIWGSVLLHICVTGSLMKPVSKTSPASSSKSKIVSQSEQNEKKPKLTVGDRINKLLDFKLFKHRGFMIYVIGNSIMFSGVYGPILFLTPYAKSRGIDDSSNLLLLVMAFFDMCARPIGGLIANTKFIRARVQYYFSASVLFTGICTFLCPLADSYIALVIYSVFLGLGVGSLSSVIFESLMDLVGPARFSSALGLVTLIECGPLLFGPPFAGKLVDLTGEYKYMYLACGTIVIIAGMWLFIGNAVNYNLLRKERKKEKHRMRKAARKLAREAEALKQSLHEDTVVTLSKEPSPLLHRNTESNI
ncbi:monocarboxylate transporter 2-like [Acomys russatus]|uniref:monocarboxylate transporter 2-like n=1 Tax=Acomys russatus TaxID=60746 RepID=UPI0021E2616B|nr:monocarboxylate transporter 2-like [Acomys russatus]